LAGQADDVEPERSGAEPHRGVVGDQPRLAAAILTKVQAGGQDLFVGVVQTVAVARLNEDLDRCPGSELSGLACRTNPPFELGQ
jgi:hypothetical protein